MYSNSQHTLNLRFLCALCGITYMFIRNYNYVCVTSVAIQGSAPPCHPGIFEGVRRNGVGCSLGRSTSKIGQYSFVIVGDY